VNGFEEQRVDAAKARRAARKDRCHSASSTSATYTCDTCGPTCSSRIGLFSHQRSRRWDSSRRRLIPLSRQPLKIQKNFKVIGQSSRSHGVFAFFFACMLLRLPADSTWPWARLEDLVFRWVFFWEHDNSWTAALCLMFLCFFSCCGYQRMHEHVSLNNLWKPIKYQVHRSKVKVTWFLCFFCVCAWYCGYPRTVLSLEQGNLVPIYALYLCTNYSNVRTSCSLNV